MNAFEQTSANKLASIIMKSISKEYQELVWITHGHEQKMKLESNSVADRKEIDELFIVINELPSFIEAIIVFGQTLGLFKDEKDLANDTSKMTAIIPFVFVGLTVYARSSKEREKIGHDGLDSLMSIVTRIEALSHCEKGLKSMLGLFAASTQEKMLKHK